MVLLTYDFINYCITNYGLINYGITDYDITNYDITNYGIINYDITNNDITNYGIINYDITNYGIITYDIINYGITDYDITNYGIYGIVLQGWDRVRRCDQQDYDPPCGPCEGVGGIPTGSDNDDIALTSCTVVATPQDIPSPHPIVWGTQWTLPLAYEILIGQKNDPFCFQTFPGADSVSQVASKAHYYL